MPEKIDIHGVMIDNVTMEEALDKVLSMLEGQTPQKIFTPNSEIIMQATRDPELRDILNSAELIVPDGAGVILASRIMKNELKEKVSGIDLVRQIFANTKKRPASFFILGGKPGVAEKASVNIVYDYPKAKIKGYRNGYFDESEVPEIIKQINESRAEILLVGLGAPKQEKWIHRYANELNCKILMGIGGSIDVFAGTAKLAPEFMRRAGLEWLYRLIKEPKRAKRMLDLPRFILLTLKKTMADRKN
ncbi:MAG TPA: WecB/TagA/CpsF family glycosyltransferase [Clostridiaceae bacterium]|jgi:N-acetylglucosaminyldiphosphoundecaprenol N-acetyl-beta-D-mannosaminyltransferase|nr:WecB/TagA/CpsF family glycosyltransferase [Clostridiaceae bacterium]